MQQERIIAALTASFGMLALVLACVGVYGVMAYSVAQRTSEIGIRMALGARPRQVLTMVLREGTWISVAGIACGIGASIFAARLVQSLLYGLKANDSLCLRDDVAAGVGGTRGKLDSGSSCGRSGTYAGFSTGVSFNRRRQAEARVEPSTGRLVAFQIYLPASIELKEKALSNTEPFKRNCTPL